MSKNIFSNLKVRRHRPLTAFLCTRNLFSLLGGFGYFLGLELLHLFLDARYTSSVSKAVGRFTDEQNWVWTLQTASAVRSLRGNRTKHSEISSRKVLLRLLVTVSLAPNQSAARIIWYSRQQSFESDERQDRVKDADSRLHEEGQSIPVVFLWI